MSGFPILDLVIGMIFVYFLLSIISSSVVEMILTLTKARAKILADWLFKIFDKGVSINGKQVVLGQMIMDHCSVTGLTEDGKSPSYIDAKNFTSALLEKITYNPDDPKSIATNINTLISKIRDTDLLSTELQRTFLTYAYDAKDSYQQASAKTTSALEMFRSKIEDWYNSSTDRLTGDLKRRYSRPFTFLVATVTVLLLNADSVSIAKFLYSNPDARANVVAQAYKVASDSTVAFNKKIAQLTSAHDTTAQQLEATMKAGLDNINKAKAALNENIPFGWTATTSPQGEGWCLFLSIILKLTGLLSTIFAIMLGAPFWFDLLNKVVNLRGTGNKPPDNAGSSNAAGTPDTTSSTPLTITVNTNKEEEAEG